MEREVEILHLLYFHLLAFIDKFVVGPVKRPICQRQQYDKTFQKDHLEQNKIPCVTLTVAKIWSINN